MLKPKVREPIVKCSLSKIKFPELCPVCLDEPEDLVAVTVISSEQQRTTRSWANIYGNTPDVPIGGLQSSVVFWIPACLAHSRSVRTFKTRLAFIVGFFVLFYPILYVMLLTLSAAQSGKSISEPLLYLVGLIAIMVFLVLFSFLPRAFERAIAFVKVEKEKDIVFVFFRNELYRKRFIEKNEEHCQIVSEKDHVHTTP